MPTNVQDKSSNSHILFCLKTRKNNDSPISRPHRWTIYIIGLLETFIFGGCIFGWAQLVYVLKNEEIFLNLCKNFNENITANISEPELSLEEIKLQGCPEQDKKFALIYTIGCIFYGAVGLLSGFMLYHAGLVLARITATLALVCGFLAMSYTTGEHTHWLYVSMILLSYGGAQLRLSGLQFCNLFPNNKSTALTIISGSYAASAGLFLVFQIGQNNGLTLWFMRLCLALLAFLSMLLTAIMPWHHIPYEQQQQSNQSSEQSMPLSNSLLSISSITHYYWFMVLISGLRFYTLTFNPWISKISDTNEEAGVYSFMFSISSFVCPFVTPLPGMINDYFTRRAKLAGPNKEKILQKDLKSPVATLVIMIVLTVLLQFCLMLYYPVAIYLSLIILIIIRPCIVSVGIAFVRIRFPAEHFDRLNGICDTAMALFTPLQYPFFLWIQHSPIMAMTCFIIIVVISLLHPFHLLSTRYRRKIAKERFQNVTKDQILINDEESEKNGII